MLIILLSALIISCNVASDNKVVLNEKVIENKSEGDSLSMDM